MKYEVLISKKKNSAPNTEFKVQSQGDFNDRITRLYNQTPYKKNEYDIIKDIENNKEYFTKNKEDNTFTKVEIGHRGNEKYLKSINNKTKKDNIQELEEYQSN